MTPPRARTEVLGPARGAYALVIPVWNEGERLAHQLAKLAGYTDRCDIVISDKPSTDGFTDPARLAAAGVHALVTLEEPGGYSSSLRAAIAYVLGRSYRGVIFMDGNNKDDPTGIPRIIERLEAGIDYVQGSRYARGGRAIDNPFERTLMIRFVHAPLFSVATRRWWTDTTNGFRGFSRRVLEDPLVDALRSDLTRYELPTYLAWKAIRAGYRTGEVPVTRTYPTSGPLPTKITGLRQHWRMLKPLLMVLFRRW